MGIFIGPIVIICGILCATVWRKKIQSHNIEIQYMKTTPLPELKSNLEENAAHGLTGYREYVEVKGVAAADEEIKTPYSEKPVAYFEAELYQVYEEMERYEDSDGKMKQRAVRRESQMSSQKSPGPIVLKDPATGDQAYVTVLEYGMRLDTVKGLDKFEPSNNMKQYNFFERLTSFGDMGSRTLGFRMVEKIIPLNHSLYVLGEAYLENSRLNITKPADAKRPYIVSTMSEEDIVEDHKSSANMALWGGIILAVIGFVLIFVI